MNYAVWLGLISACALAAQSTPNQASIEGHVLNSSTGAPVRKAAVTLRSSQVDLNAETDGEGRFQFTALPAGVYKLSAKRPGFLDRAGHRAITLAADGHVTGAEIRLPPQGVISGLVLDEDGDPIGDARVTLYRQVFEDGKPRWASLNASVTTNDLGEYRWPHLKPGHYLVRAQDDTPATHNRYGDAETTWESVRVSLSTYYPNTLSRAEASPVEVGPGADVSGIDIHIVEVAIPHHFHVSGKVLGVPQDSQKDVYVNFFSEDELPLSEAYGSANPPDCTFTVSLGPGRYRYVAGISDEGREAYGAGSISVAGDVTGLVVVLSPEPEMTGRITVAEGAAGVKLKGVRTNLSMSGGSFNLPDVWSDATGKMTFGKPMLPAHYRLKVYRSTLPEGCYVQQVKLAGQTVSPDDFEIRTSAEIEIVLSRTAATVTGSAQDDEGKPVPGAMVLLVPGDGRSPAEMQTANDDGKFKFTPLRPGGYEVYAWEEVDKDLCQDPEFLRRFASRATPVTVGPSETQEAQPRVIPAQ